MPPRIKPALRPGEVRRCAPVDEGDPERARLVAVVSLRERDPPAFRREAQAYILDNLGLAISFAQSVDARHVPLDDRIHACVVGLMKALAGFDLALAGRFSTYAVWKMRHEVMTLVRRDEALVPAPGQLVDDKRALEAATQRLAAELGCPPDDAQLLDALREAERLDKEGPRRWARCGEESVRRVREAYAGFSGSRLSARAVAPSPGLTPEHQASVRQAMACLSPPELAVFADEHDMWPVPESSLPASPVVRRALLLQATRKLRRRLGGDW